MDADERRLREERRLRQAAVTAASQQAPEPADQPEADDETARIDRMEQRTLWVDLQVRRAMQRGDFDNLPGAGKPIPGLDGTHDPDWWLKSLIAREQITGVLPPALALRREDAALDARLDQEATADGVRAAVLDFNQRVVEARRQLLGGPPVVTATRDVEAEVTRWQDRRAQRTQRLRDQQEQTEPAAGHRRRWPWQRRHR